MQPSDQEIEEVVVYLKQMKGLKDKFDHLNKFVTKRVFELPSIDA